MIKARNILAEVRKHGKPKAYGNLQACIREGKLNPNEVSIREVAKATMGDDFVERCNPTSKAGFSEGENLLEAGEAVDSTAFSNISGQLIYTQLMDRFEQPEFIASRLVRTVDTPFNGEKIPGIEGLGDSAKDVKEGEDYPEASFGDDYRETPVTTKRGLIVSVTRETIFFDRTGQVLDTAASVGESLALRKEYRIIDMILGITNNYNWRGTAYNTYNASTPWANVLASTPLVDWTDIDEANQKFVNMVDPNTGEPIIVRANQILVMPAKQMTSEHILNATETRVGDGASQTTQRIGANPVGNGRYSVFSSPFIYKRLLAALETNAAKAQLFWFIGDFARAFEYRQNWGMSVVRSPINSEADFNRDIVVRFKASERGAPAVAQPRAVVKVYDTVTG